MCFNPRPRAGANRSSPKPKKLWNLTQHLRVPRLGYALRTTKLSPALQRRLSTCCTYRLRGSPGETTCASGPRTPTLENQRPLGIVARLRSDMLDPPLPVVTQKVKPQ